MLAEVRRRGHAARWILQRLSDRLGAAAAARDCKAKSQEQLTPMSVDLRSKILNSPEWQAASFDAPVVPAASQPVVFLFLFLFLGIRFRLWLLRL